MSPPEPEVRRLSFAEYLALDEASPLRWEYAAGRAYAMTGATPRHNRIGLNIVLRLEALRGDGPCQLFLEGVRLALSSTHAYYPDVMVVCDPRGVDERMAYAPCLVVEVLSPSTRRIDLNEKVAAYRALPSLQTLLLVEQGVRHVVHHWRDETGAWREADLVGEGAIGLSCPTPGFLSLDAIYRDVTLDPPRPRRVREALAAGFAPDAQEDDAPDDETVEDRA